METWFDPGLWYVGVGGQGCGMDRETILPMSSLVTMVAILALMVLSLSLISLMSWLIPIAGGKEHPTDFCLRDGFPSIRGGIWQEV